MVQKKLPLINSAHGSETRNIINELIKLFNGMGYTYNESLQKARDILAEAQQTNDMNESVQQQINALIAESGTSDAEVLQARFDAEGNEYPVLKERLDTKDVELLSQMREVEKISRNTQSAIRKVYISFVTDDGGVGDMNNLKPITDQYNYPFNVALISERDYSSSNPTLENDYLTMQNNHGWQFLSHIHTPNVRLTDLSESDLNYQLEHSKKLLEERGFDIDGVVYPHGAVNKLVRHYVQKYYRYGVGVHGDLPNDSLEKGINRGIFNSFNITRTAVGSYFDGGADNIVNGMASDSLEYYKFKVDQAVDQGDTWLIFMLHPHGGDHPNTGVSEQQQRLLDLCEYINQLDIPVVTVSEAFDVFGNAFESGDVDGGTGFAVNKEGKSNIQQLEPLNSYNANTTPKGFPRGKVTTFYVNGDARYGFPDDRSGIVTVYRHEGLNDTYGNVHQTFIAHRTNEIWQRHEQNDGGWSDWEPLNVLETVNSYSSNTLAIDFPNGKKTEFYVTSANNQGFPRGQSGVVTVIKPLRSTEGSTHQTFTAHRSNEIWQRYEQSDGTWSEWELQGMAVSRVNLFASNAEPSAFPRGVKTIYFVDAANRDGYPGDRSGMVEVYSPESPTEGNVLMRFTPHRSNEVYSRYEQNDGTWSSWEKVSVV